MSGTWFTVRVELLVSGSTPSDPPRPGRLLLVSGDMLFRTLATAIDRAFDDVIEIDWIDTRWDEGLWDDLDGPDAGDPVRTDWRPPDGSMAEVRPPRPPFGSEEEPAPTVTHAFTLADGTRIVPGRGATDDTNDVLPDVLVRLARLQPGETFVYEPDADGGWRYACTVVAGPDEPDEAEEPDEPDTEAAEGGRDEPRPRSALPLTPLVVHAWGALPEGEDPADTVARDGRADRRTVGPAASLFGPAAGRAFDADGVARLHRALDDGDVIGLVVLLAEHDPMAVVHLAGPTLARAAADGHPGAREATLPLVVPLRERGWPGDAELADELAVALALEGAEAPMLAPTPVDLATLAAVLDGPGERGNTWRLDIGTGRLTPPPAGPDAGRTIPVLGLGTRPGIDDLFAFTRLDPDGLAGRIADSAPRTLWGPLEDALLRSPTEGPRWTLFAQERRLGRARRWLAEQGLRPVLPEDAAA